MNQLQAIQADLEQQVGVALKRHAMANLGTLQPFRLPQIARELVSRLIAEPTPAAGQAMGKILHRQGLSLISLIEAYTATLVAIVQAALPATVGEEVCRFLGGLLDGFLQAEKVEADYQRTTMERAFMTTIEEQHGQEEQLRNAISELSTPIMPVYEGILVLPLIGSVDDRRASEITERLLESIAFYQADIVIIDITGVPVMDTHTANHLLRTVRAAELLGSRIILVGIGAEIAQTIVHIGVGLGSLVVLANLQAGLAYALQSQGLGIRAL